MWFYAEIQSKYADIGTTLRQSPKSQCHPFWFGGCGFYMVKYAVWNMIYYKARIDDNYHYANYV